MDAGSCLRACFWSALIQTPHNTKTNSMPTMIHQRNVKRRPSHTYSKTVKPKIKTNVHSYLWHYVENHRNETQFGTILSQKQLEAYSTLILPLQTDLEIIRKRQLTSQTHLRGLVDHMTTTSAQVAPSSSSMIAQRTKGKPGSATTKTMMMTTSPTSKDAAVVSPIQW